MTVIQTFEIDFFQYLDAEGKIVEALPAFAENSDILLDLYRRMVLTRVFDAKAVALQRTGQMGTFPSSLGQEAVAVGTAHAMEKTDVLCPYYRDQGGMFIRGVKMSELLTYWGGDERGSCFIDDKEDFPIAVPIASQCLHATGVAYAMKYRKQRRAVVTTIGDGGTSKGDFYEAINLAGAWQLPVVFVINNNYWAISVPLSKQTHAATLAQKAIAAGIEGVQVDGNDVIAVRDTVAKALEKARSGKGPTVIEAMTYRLCDHTTADDAKRYCAAEEVDKAWKQEPVLRLRAYLESKNLWSEEKEKSLQEECSKEVEQAVKEYLSVTPPKITDMLDYLYEKWPDNLQDQREELGGLHA